VPEIRIARYIVLCPFVVEDSLSQLAETVIDISNVVKQPSILHTCLVCDPFKTEKRLAVQLAGDFPIVFNSCPAKILSALFDQREELPGEVFCRTIPHHLRFENEWPVAFSCGLV
jgi:hypothetical protein